MTATLFVADGGTGTCTQTSPCGSIQTAVSEGEGYSGEAVTVHVGPGTYTGGISVSAASLASLTIEGSGASNTKVTGTTFLRGFLVSAGTLSIDDLTVMDALVTTGSGVLNNGTLTLAHDTFRLDLAGNVGGAVGNTGTVVAIDDYFTDDSATQGGDVYNSHTATFMATGDTFVGNFGSATTGGGIYNAGTVTATDDTFIGEKAITGGGIYNVGTLTATDDTFSEIHALLQGGGIVNHRGTVAATNDTFFRNSAGTTTPSDPRSWRHLSGEDASRRKGPVELLCDGPNPTPAAGLSRASLVGVQEGGPAGATTPSPAVASSDRSRWRARDCRRRDARTPAGRRDGGGPRGRSRAQPTVAGGEHE